MTIIGCIASRFDLSNTRRPQLGRLHRVNISVGVNRNAVAHPRSRRRHLLVPDIARDGFGIARKGITMAAAASLMMRQQFAAAASSL